jgi:hypothetical protein
MEIAMPNKKTTIYKAHMPEVGGYGMEGYGLTSKEALDALKTFYDHQASGLSFEDGPKTFEEAMKYFSGTVTKIELPSAGHEGDLGETEITFDE